MGRGFEHAVYLIDELLQKIIHWGELGSELNRIIDMIRENRIVSSPGVRVEHNQMEPLHISQEGAP